MLLTPEEFDEAVGDALDEVPAELLDLMDNVVFLCEDEPPEDDPDLLGVYDGVPLTERGSFWAAGSLPDRITIFRGPTLRMCTTREQVRHEVTVTVVHEIAHHFGIDDAAPARARLGLKETREVYPRPRPRSAPSASPDPGRPRRPRRPAHPG